jgi:hypothetical protein
VPLRLLAGHIDHVNFTDTTTLKAVPRVSLTISSFVTLALTVLHRNPFVVFWELLLVELVKTKPAYANLFEKKALARPVKFPKTISRDLQSAPIRPACDPNRLFHFLLSGQFWPKKIPTLARLDQIFTYFRWSHSKN